MREAPDVTDPELLQTVTDAFNIAGDPDVTFVSWRAILRADGNLVEFTMFCPRIFAQLPEQYAGHTFKVSLDEHPELDNERLIAAYAGTECKQYAAAKWQKAEDLAELRRQQLRKG